METVKVYSPVNDENIQKTLMGHRFGKLLTPRMNSWKHRKNTPRFMNTR